MHKNQQPCRIPTSSITAVDVLCGRQRHVFNHTGNITFRNIVAHYLDSYTTSPYRSRKTSIVKEIIDIVRSRGGRFLRLDPVTSDWIVLTNEESKDKVGHSLRDTNKGSKRSTAHATTNSGARVDWNTSTSQPIRNDLRPDTSFSQEKYEHNINRMASIERIQNGYTHGSGHYEGMRYRHSDSSSSHSASLILEMLPNKNSSSPHPVVARTMDITQPDCSTGDHVQPLNTAFGKYCKQRTHPIQQPKRQAIHASSEDTSEMTLRGTFVDVGKITNTDDNDHEFLDRIHEVLGPLIFDGRDPLNDFILSDEDS